MGDRANVCVKDGAGAFYLYTHWEGYRLPDIVKNALARKQRWDDPCYLSRIIFCEMIKGREREETGFGISVFCCEEDEDRMVTVDIPANMVQIGQTAPFTFAEFIALECASWPE